MAAGTAGSNIFHVMRTRRALVTNEPRLEYMELGYPHVALSEHQGTLEETFRVARLRAGAPRLSCFNLCLPCADTAHECSRFRLTVRDVSHEFAAHLTPPLATAAAEAVQYRVKLPPHFRNPHGVILQ